MKKFKKKILKSRKIKNKYIKFKREKIRMKIEIKIVFSLQKVECHSKTVLEVNQVIGLSIVLWVLDLIKNQCIKIKIFKIMMKIKIFKILKQKHQ